MNDGHWKKFNAAIDHAKEDKEIGPQSGYALRELESPRINICREMFNRHVAAHQEIVDLELENRLYDHVAMKVHWDETPAETRRRLMIPPGAPIPRLIDEYVEKEECAVCANRGEIDSDAAAHAFENAAVMRARIAEMEAKIDKLHNDALNSVALGEIMMAIERDLGKVRAAIGYVEFDRIVSGKEVAPKPPREPAGKNWMGHWREGIK